MEPLFIEGIRGPLFGVFHPSVETSDQALLFLPPFAEENNRSRHVAAALARACADRGIAALLLDPFGTGDSSGEFGDADWQCWIEDGQKAVDWLKKRGGKRITLAGLRSGGLLASCLAANLDFSPERLILWSPATNGGRFLRQFLRLRVAARVIGDDAGEEKVDDMLVRLTAGESLEVGGYQISPEMAHQLAEQKLEAACPHAGTRVLWLEVGGSSSDELKPGVTRICDQWRHSGLEVVANTIAGPSFWLRQEPEPCPALVEDTIKWLSTKEPGNA